MQQAPFNATDTDDRFWRKRMSPALRCAVPQLLQAGNGSVIAIASMYGLVWQYERVAYCGAKAGMIGMVRAMALDIADGRTNVRVNAIVPGFIEGGMLKHPNRLRPLQNLDHAHPRRNVLLCLATNRSGSLRWHKVRKTKARRKSAR
jgi:NAD(P)-dependent dehydrogenase (short-subunit alcohol dehydrogenase family)